MIMFLTEISTQDAHYAYSLTHMRIYMYIHSSARGKQRVDYTYLYVDTVECKRKARG